MSPRRIATKCVTARKPHECMTCGAIAVQPGESYVKDTYVYDGRVYDWIACAACSEIAGDVFDWSGRPDEGITRDDYREWAEESVNDPIAGEAARAYLSRTGGASDE